tara:strand:+ start:27051 stop:27518 length:468 start_codon:yes stop_codon:yes gene_type:complete
MNDLTTEEKVALLRLLIGDIPTSPFYQLFTDEQLESFLVVSGGSVMTAAKYAAISASMQLAGYSTRERTGDIEVWNSLSSNYLKALDYFITNTDKEIPSGLMPWAAGISKAEMKAYLSDPDRVKSPLIDFSICDQQEAFNCENPYTDFQNDNCGC